MLRPIRKDEIARSTVRGQYAGYTKVKGVRSGSRTETYFKIKAFLDNARWDGTPFYLESGKGLKENKVEINIYFKEVIRHHNKLSFMVKPEEGIAVRFWVKKPGLTSAIEPKNLSFTYGRVSPAYQTQTEAYEKVLFDCIDGEQMLFASTDEVAAAWRFIMPILEGWAKNKAPLIKYKEGSEVKKKL